MPVSAKYYASKHVLGNVVNKSFLEETSLIGVAQAKIDGARGQLNSLISLRRSLNQTITEVGATGVPVEKLEAEVEKLSKEIEEAATSYVEIRLEEERNIQKSHAKIAAEPLWDELESPIDFNRSQVITRPIGIDAMKLDAQYFNFNESDKEGSLNKVKNFVRGFAEDLGKEAAQDLSEKAGVSVERQMDQFEVVGTLVIAASCTHANAHVLYPIKLDVEESLMLWNRIFKDDRIITSNPDALRLEVETFAKREPNYLNLISGVTYGSSFVGMMHLLRHQGNSASGEGEDSEEAKDETKSDAELAESLRDYLKLGSWLQDISGGIGIDPTILADVRNQLSMSKVRAHVTVDTLGVLPSIKSNLVGSNLSQITKLKGVEKVVAGLEQQSDGDHSTLSSRAESARLGGRAMAVEGSRIGNLVGSLRQADEAADQVMNLGTLLSAFDDYANKIKRETSGLPISYFFRRINRHEIIQAFLAQKENNG